MKYSETKSNLFLTKFISEEKFLNFSLMLHDMDTKVTFSSTMVYACSNISKVLKVFKSFFFFDIECHLWIRFSKKSFNEFLYNFPS